MVSILFLYTLKDAWGKNLHSIAISDDNKNNVACINDEKDTKINKTVDDATIEKIKDIIRKYKESLEINGDYHGKEAVLDGAINHFLINSDGDAKEINVYNMAYTNDEEIQPLREMLNEIKDILCNIGVGKIYFEEN